MTFVNTQFLLYFLPIALGIYALFRRSISKQNVCLLIFSLVFYAWIELRFFLFLIVAILVNFWLALRIEKAQNERKPAKKYATIAYVINGGVFLVFQLLSAYIQGGFPLFGLQYTLLYNFMVPVGMGIIAMRGISYVMDVYRMQLPAERRLADLALYISFFPQLVAGPLTPYSDFKPQLQVRSFDGEMMYSGISRLVIGLGKKALIANNLSVIADQVFEASATGALEVPVLLAWLGILCVGLQLYYEFSGYADIAIGLGKIFGFRSEENFNYPYLASSMRDFWTRWNMTVKNWFDIYVLHPLNRSRSTNKDRAILHTFIMFVLLGTLRRFSLSILLWAAVQTLFITGEDVITYDKRKIPRPVTHLYVLIVLSLSWVLFRSNTLNGALSYMQNMLGMNQNGIMSSMAWLFLKEYWPFILAGIVFIFPIAPAIDRRVQAAKGKYVRPVLWIGYTLLLLAILGLVLLYLARGQYTLFHYYSF